MYADSHIHTSFSSDSDTDPRAQIERAIELGMKQVTITDHYDIDFPPGELDFLFDADDYMKQMNTLREEYADRIDLGIGVELGLQPHLIREVPEFAARYPFDFIIGSTHVSRHLDPYEADQFFAGLTEEEAYRIYFEEELENIRQFRCFDVVGHLDYVVRYGPNRSRDYTYPKYQEILDEILKIIIDRQIGLEYNTAGFKAGLGCGHPFPDVWKRYRELGGELLTIGSDAHTPDVMALEFDRAGEFLKSCGFRYVAVFRSRKPEFHKLK